MAEIVLEVGLAPPAPSYAKALRVGRASSPPPSSHPLLFSLFSCPLGLLLGTRPSCLPQKPLQWAAQEQLSVAASPAPAELQGFGPHTLQFKLKHQHPPERALWVPTPHWCMGWHLAGG